MKTKAQRRHDIKAAIARMQHDMSDAWVDRSIPDGWNFLEVGAPIVPHKTKITLRVDSDMLRSRSPFGGVRGGAFAERWSGWGVLAGMEPCTIRLVNKLEAHPFAHLSPRR